MPHVIIIVDELGNEIGSYSPSHNNDPPGGGGSSLTSTKDIEPEPGKLMVHLGKIFDRWIEKQKPKR